jgi:hypothetical protein
VKSLAVAGCSRTEHDVSNTAAPAQAERRRTAPRAGGHVGRLVVGDHVGHLAAQAAQAVRRAGLRPGLDRSFGCEAEQVGLVLAQDPPAGSELARNSMVKLYVAAPGPAPAPETSAPEAEMSLASATPVDSPAGPDWPARDTLLPDSGARRARKPRPGTEVRRQTPHPAPSMRAGEEPLARPAARQTPMLDVSETDPAASECEGLHDAACFGEEHPTQPHEPLAARVEDLFSGHGDETPGWRRVYPRRPIAGTLRRMLRWLGSHRLPALAACALLSLWGGEAVARVLAGQHAPAPVASVRPTPNPAGQHPSGPAVLRAGHGTHRARGRAQNTPIRRARATLITSSRARAARRESAAARPGSGVPPTPVGSAAEPAPAADPQQSTGGPFSP